MAEEKASKEKFPKEKAVGKVIHYYTNLGVAAIELKGELNAGDEIHITGHTSDFKQNVDSMQLDHKEVEKAKKGDSIGIKITEHARENDTVYRVEK